MKNIVVLMLSLIICLGTLPVNAEDKIAEIVFASEEWQDATNADGSGLYWDLFRAVYEPVGIKTRFIIRSYNGAVKLVQLQKADALVGSYVDEVEGAIFPKWHFDVDHVKALYKKSANIEWKGPETISGKKAAWIKGYAYDEYLSVPVQKYEFDEREDLLRVLDKGRVDFYLDAEADMIDALSQGRDINNYKIETVLDLKLFLAFANNSKGQKLKEIFDDRFPRLIQSGEIEALFKKWKSAGFKYPF